MRHPSSFEDLSPKLAPIELVHGPKDGLRDTLPLEDDGKPAETVVYGEETYARRDEPERCTVDELRAWHYDVVRVPAVTS